MAKQNTHQVNQTEKNPNFVGVISIREIEKRIRKATAPATQIHRSKKSYSRRPKHRQHDPQD